MQMILRPIPLHLQLCSAGRKKIATGRVNVGASRVPAETATAKDTVVIKKYANRRLYNTATSTYVTLDDLAQMVKKGTDFSVCDAKTGEDITKSVLTQIIFEEESKGQSLLPINFLRQLIRFYGDSLQGLIPGYLEMSLGNLAKEQEHLRKQLAEVWGGDPLKAMEEQAKRNVAMFSEAMKMFNPFAAAMAPPQTQKPAEQTSAKDELQALKDQLAKVQRTIDALANSK
jgi:polyhydroxyalkanoate synthesis repressor PhaR